MKLGFLFGQILALPLLLYIQNKNIYNINCFATYTRSLISRVYHDQEFGVGFMSNMCMMKISKKRLKVITCSTEFVFSSACLSVCLFVCLLIYMFVCLFDLLFIFIVWLDGLFVNLLIGWLVSRLVV